MTTLNPAVTSAPGPGLRQRSTVIDGALGRLDESPRDGGTAGAFAASANPPNSRSGPAPRATVSTMTSSVDLGRGDPPPAALLRRRFRVRPSIGVDRTPPRASRCRRCPHCRGGQGDPGPGERNRWTGDDRGGRTHLWADRAPLPRRARWTRGAHASGPGRWRRGSPPTDILPGAVMAHDVADTPRDGRVGRWEPAMSIGAPEARADHPSSRSTSGSGSAPSGIGGTQPPVESDGGSAMATCRRLRDCRKPGATVVGGRVLATVGAMRRRARRHADRRRALAATPADRRCPHVVAISEVGGAAVRP